MLDAIKKDRKGNFYISSLGRPLPENATIKNLGSHKFPVVSINHRLCGGHPDIDAKVKVLLDKNNFTVWTFKIPRDATVETLKKEINKEKMVPAEKIIIMQKDVILSNPTVIEPLCIRRNKFEAVMSCDFSAESTSSFLKACEMIGTMYANRIADLERIIEDYRTAAQIANDGAGQM